MEGFDTALICLNGHMLNDSSRFYPKYNSLHCEKSGA